MNALDLHVYWNIKPSVVLNWQKKETYTTEKKNWTKDIGLYLSLHVHDDDGVGPVTDDELLHVPGQGVDTVHRDVAARGTTKRLERVLTLCRLDVPHFDCAIRTRTNEDLKCLREGKL